MRPLPRSGGSPGASWPQGGRLWRQTLATAIESEDHVIPWRLAPDPARSGVRTVGRWRLLHESGVTTVANGWNERLAQIEAEAGAATVAPRPIRGVG
jgi:hypothetical protein